MHFSITLSGAPFNNKEFYSPYNPLTTVDIDFLSLVKSSVATLLIDFAKNLEYASGSLVESTLSIFGSYFPNFSAATFKAASVGSPSLLNSS